MVVELANRGPPPGVSPRRSRKSVLGSPRASSAGPVKNLFSVTHIPQPIWLGPSFCGVADFVGAGSNEQPCIKRIHTLSPTNLREAGVVKKAMDTVPRDLLDEPIVLYIDRAEQEAFSLEASGHYEDATERLEMGVAGRLELFTDGHEDYLLAAERFVMMCNVWAVMLLRKGKHDSTLQLLMKADEALREPTWKFRRRLLLRAQTLNNLCCYFRARGKLNAALRFAERALQLEQRYKEAVDPCRTYLNASVLLSLMGRNKEAIARAESAVALLHEDQDSLTQKLTELPDGADTTPIQNHLLAVSCVLVISYYNLWIQATLLCRQDAIDFLARAIHLANMYCKEGLHPKLKARIDAAQRVLLARADHGYHDYQSTPMVRGRSRDRMISGSMRETRSASPRKISRPPTIDPEAFDQHVHARPGTTASDSRNRSRSPKRTTTHPEIPHPLTAPRKVFHTLDTFHFDDDDHDPHVNGGPPLQIHCPVPDDKGKTGTAPVRFPRLKPTYSGAYDNTQSRIDRVVDTTPASEIVRKLPDDASPSRPATAGPFGGRRNRMQRSLSPVRPGTAREGQGPPWRNRQFATVKMQSMPRGERPPSPLQGVSRAIKSAYAYHARKKAEEQADLPSTHENDSVVPGRPSHSLLPAINVIGQRVQDRADKGLGTATDGRRRRAATRIQAVWRGHAVRQWESAEVAASALRRQSVMEVPEETPAERLAAIAEAYHHSEVNRPPALEGSNFDNEEDLFGPGDNKRRLAYRVVFAARQAFVDYGAAVRIQAFWRGVYTRLELERIVKALAEVCATKIQAMVRCRIEMCAARRRQRAALGIQISWKRSIAMRRYKALHSAVIFIVRVVKGCLVRQRIKRLKAGAIIFQKAARGCSERRMVKSWHAAVVEIQRMVRGFQARALFLHQKRAVIVIMAWYRGHKLRKRYLKIIQANAKLQAFYRGRFWRQRGTSKTFLKSALPIQGLVRGFLTRRFLFRQVPMIQAWWRAHLWRQKRLNAVLKMQAFRKGEQTRWRIALLVALACALQRNWRRKAAWLYLERLETAAISCQRFRKGLVTRRFLAEMYGHRSPWPCRLDAIKVINRTRRKAAVKIQAYWKMREVRVKMKFQQLGFVPHKIPRGRVSIEDIYKPEPKANGIDPRSSIFIMWFISSSFDRARLSDDVIGC